MMKAVRQAITSMYYRMRPRDTKQYYLNRGDEFWVNHLSDRWVDHPSKKYMAEAVNELSPASVLEVGCNAGANLLVLRKLNPTVPLYGIELNGNSVDYGNKKIGHMGISLKVGDILSSDFNLPDKYDVVFSNALLVLFDREKVKVCLDRMSRFGRRLMVLVEWHSGEIKDSDKIYHGLYVQNYERLIRSMPGMTLQSIEKIPADIWDTDGWLQYGHLITVRLDG